IPVHLLTEEAFALYFRHLRPGGILAVHISNRYLDLKPVVRAAAARLGKTARLVDTNSDNERGAYGSTWGLLSDSPPLFAQAAPLPASPPGAPARRRRRRPPPPPKGPACGPTITAPSGKY